MSGEKRRDFRRFATAALAFSTLALVYYHFVTREKALADARRAIGKIHEQVRNKVDDEVKDLQRDLNLWIGDNWTSEKPWPARFTRVGTHSERLQTLKEHSFGGEKFWVDTDTTQTDVLQEVAREIGPADGGRFGVALALPGPGTATVEVRAQIVSESPPVPNLVLLQVKIRRGPIDPVPIDAGGPMKVLHGEWSGPREYKVAFTEADLRNRQEIVFEVPPGSPPVEVQCRVRVGEPQRREVAIGVQGVLPARTIRGVNPEDGREIEVVVPAEPAFVLGYVSLDHFRERVREAVGQEMETEAFGDRVYLTDVSGTVVEAVPDYPRRIRERVLGGGRASLSSAATLRVKVGSKAGVDGYEGFGGERVLGAYGPLQAINGGLIVEREERLVLAGFRGLRPWHVSAVLFVLFLLYPLVPPLVRRVREDTELPRLLSYAKGFLPYIGVIVACSALYSAGQGIFAYQGKVVVDDVVLSGESTAYDRLYGICWFLAGLAVAMFAVNWVKEYLGKVIQNRMVVELRCLLCDKIANLPMAFHTRQRAGDLLSRIQNDVSETSRGLEMLFGDVISDPILILTLAVSAFVINWRLALVVFVGLPVILLPISYFGRAIKKYARHRQARKADVTHAINQMLSGIRVVKAFRMEDHESKRIRTVSDNFLREALKVAKAQVTSKETLELFSNVSIAVVLALGGYLVLERQVTVGDLTAFAALIGRMYRSTKNLTSNYNKMQESLAGTERIFEVFDAPDTMADRPGARALVRPRGEIAFEDVSFRYVEDGPWVLRNLSFRVPVGTSVALVGATGAGKSTMLDLVARFYDPQEGRVSIDGVDLRDFSRSSLMAQVAVVTQEPFLFNASIGENLRYGKPGASQVEIESAARAAHIHDEVLRQPEGYETVVGERGARLSGGQRQRLTIARAILKDPPILLLDEATSALDSRVERAVQEALNNLMKDRTTFVIAHRLSTIQGVDRILVLEGGTIVESGTHAELLALPSGHYRRLYEIQFSAASKRGEGEAEAATG